MTKQEKQLLLIDLSARFPYGVIIKKKVCHTYQIEELNDIGYGQRTDKIYVNGYPIEQSKPYLRPMSSMTEEEEREYNGLLKPLGDFMFEQEEEFKPIQLYKNVPFELYDFFNSHHLDFRGLIPMGLALEAPEGMYK